MDHIAGIFKALHIIFIVTWFAGLFALVRLFVYHVESSEPILIRQLLTMERRMWYVITWPSCVLAISFGLVITVMDFLPLTNHPWLIVKLSLVAGLFLYHLSCGYIYRTLRTESCHLTSFQLRLWNEVSTLFLFAIVFLAVMKENLSQWKALVGLMVLGIVLIASISIYQKSRKRRQKKFPDDKPSRV